MSIVRSRAGVYKVFAVVASLKFYTTFGLHIKEGNIGVPWNDFMSEIGAQYIWYGDFIFQFCRGVALHLFDFELGVAWDCCITD